MFEFEYISDLFVELVFEYGPKLLGAVVLLIVGLWFIGRIARLLRTTFEKRDIDPSLRPFLSGLVKTILQVLLVVSVMSMLGLEMTSFIAILGAAGLAVGMALSGTLQNFAGGVMILIFKPYKVGDFIEGAGYSGTINQIQIFNTIMKTGDNKTIIIPNSNLANNSIVNYSAEEKRRVDFTFGIGYGDSTSKGREVLNRILTADERILSDPAEPFIAVSELADSSVNFVVRVWVNKADYWGVYFDTNEKVYNEFNKEGLNIPYPQMDVHLLKEE